jgi:hypothetical protein
MRDSLKRELKVKTVMPDRYTFISMQISQVVRTLTGLSGTPPLLGTVIDALISNEDLNHANPRATKSPVKYWEHQVSEALQKGGSLQYTEER